MDRLILRDLYVCVLARNGTALLEQETLKHERCDR